MSAEAATAPVAGRTRIAPRALISLIGGLAADALHVSRSSVRVGVSDYRGALSIKITAGLPVPPLAAAAREPGAVERVGGTVLERAARTQAEVRQRTQQLTGSAVSRVNVRFSSVHIEQAGRVR